MSIFDYCCECWAELPGFPEVDEWEERRCPHCHGEHQEPYVMHRPIATYDDAIDEGIAWGSYYEGTGPKPIAA